MGHSWELSLPQLAASAVAIVLLVSLATVVGPASLGRMACTPTLRASRSVERQRSFFAARQVIDYWNQRIEMNKARWSPEMRETFDRNMQVIDQAVANSLE